MLNARQKKFCSIATIAVFLVVIGGLFILNFFTKPPPMLISERRVPAGMSELSVGAVVSGDFMDGFEDFAADSFPLRESFRTIRAATIFGPFFQTDKDGVYFDSHGIGSFQSVNVSSVEQVADKIRVVADSLDNMNIFYSIIPDKSIYSDRRMPGFDFELVEQLMRDRLPDEFIFIPLVDALNAESFYRTDLHWNQIRIDGVLETLNIYMGIEIDLSQYRQKYAGAFSGVYVGQLALPVESESLYILDNPYLSALYLNMGTREFEIGPVYDMERFLGLDPYDIFLRGAQPIIILENENPTSDRQLYLFRDSFSSSLAPLLASAYSRVTLIDLRFVDLHTLGQLIDFTPGSDVLFLYSSVVLNSSDILLVPLTS